MLFVRNNGKIFYLVISWMQYQTKSSSNYFKKRNSRRVEVESTRIILTSRFIFMFSFNYFKGRKLKK